MAAVLLGSGAAAASIVPSVASESPSGAPALVQTATAHIAGGSTIRAKLPDSVNSGNLLAIFVEYSNSSGTTISDNTGDDWSDSGNGITPWSEGYGSQVLYAADVAGGDTTVTVRFDDAVSFASVYVVEYSGLAATDPVDRASVDSGSGERLASQSLSTGDDNELLFGAGAANGQIQSSGINYTSDTMNGGDIVEDRVVAQGRYRATAWQDTDTSWVMHAVAFKTADDTPGSSDPGTPTTGTPATSTPDQSTSADSSEPPSSSEPASSSKPASSSSGGDSPTPSSTSTPTPTRTSTSASPTPTPTKTSSGTCSGTAGQPDGSDPWGGCWPGPASTGVPDGTSLTVVNGDLTISNANTVISGQDIHGCVDVTAPGVVIKDSRISCSGSALDYEGDGDGRLTVEDTTISCGSVPGSSGIGEYYVTVLRVDISACENGFDADDDVTVVDSYIHDLFQSDASHTDGLQSCCGVRLDLEHSVWFAKTGGVDGTSGINVNAQSSSPERSHDTLIKRNLLAGGAYAMYCPKTPTSNYQVIDNVFSRIFDPLVAAFGPTDSCDGETFIGNVYDNGLPVPANS